MPCKHADLMMIYAKPREITLVETEEGKHDVAFHDDSGMWTYWRVKDK